MFDLRYNHDHISRLFDILPKLKQSVIITNKYDIYELPNELRFRILGNQEMSGKSQNFVEL